MIFWIPCIILGGPSVNFGNFHGFQLFWGAILGDFFGPLEEFRADLWPEEYSDGLENFFLEKYVISAFKLRV